MVHCRMTDTSDRSDRSDPPEAGDGPGGSAFALAEAAFRSHGTLRGMAVRYDAVTGRARLSMGPDCEDGMAEYRRLESARAEPTAPHGEHGG